MKEQFMSIEKPYSVLYAVTDDNSGDDGKIYQSGPFASYEDAINFIRNCGNNGEEGEEYEDYGDAFDLDEQPVYIMTPDHEFIHITSDEVKKGSSK